MIYRRRFLKRSLLFGDGQVFEKSDSVIAAGRSMDNRRQGEKNMKSVKLFLAASGMFCLTYQVSAIGLLKDVVGKTSEAVAVSSLPSVASATSVHTAEKPWVLDTEYEAWNDRNPIKIYVKNIGKEKKGRSPCA